MGCKFPHATSYSNCIRINGQRCCIYTVLTLIFPVKFKNHNFKYLIINEITIISVLIAVLILGYSSNLKTPFFSWAVSLCTSLCCPRWWQLLWELYKAFLVWGRLCVLNWTHGRLARITDVCMTHTHTLFNWKCILSC